MVAKFQPKSRFLLILAVLLIQSCGENSSPIVLTSSPVIGETSIPAASHSPQPTNTQLPTQVPVQFIDPFVAKPRLRFVSWSPDSRWMAYWHAEGDNTPAYLAFADVQADRICEHNEISVDSVYSGDVMWTENDIAVVVTQPDEKAFRGSPCGIFPMVEKFIPPGEISILSPDGNYRADTTTKWEEELRHNTTTFTDTSTDQIVATVLWDGSPHFLSDFGWLNNEMFLIGPTVDQGVLYVTVPDGKTGNVMTGLLKLKSQEITDSPQVFSHFDSDKNRFHILVERWRYPTNLPLLLYHSEFDQIERLALDRAWPFSRPVFSPDGKWIFIGTVIDPDTIELWLQLVDPPGSAPVKVAEGAGLAGFSYESQKLAFFAQNSVQIIEFPIGKLLSQWRSAGYHIDRVWWSPDGRRLAMQGFSSGINPEAIFVIEP